MVGGGAVVLLCVVDLSTPLGGWIGRCERKVPQIGETKWVELAVPGAYQEFFDLLPTYSVSKYRLYSALVILVPSTVVHTYIRTYVHTIRVRYFL